MGLQRDSGSQSRHRRAKGASWLQRKKQRAEVRDIGVDQEVLAAEIFQPYSPSQPGSAVPLFSELSLCPFNKLHLDIRALMLHGLPLKQPRVCGRNTAVELSAYPGG